MLSNHTHQRLVALGLAGMAKAFDDQQRQPDVTALTFEQRIGLMIDREATERENKRLIARLKFASLRQNATVEDIDLRAPRGIERAFFAKLVDGDWIGRKQNSSPGRPASARVGCVGEIVLNVNAATRGMKYADDFILRNFPSVNIPSVSSLRGQWTDTKSDCASSSSSSTLTAPFAAITSASR